MHLLACGINGKLGTFYIGASLIRYNECKSLADLKTRMDDKKATACIFAAPLCFGSRTQHYTTYWTYENKLWFYDSIVSTKFYISNLFIYLLDLFKKIN